MNLKNGNITIGELLTHPKAMAVMKKEFGSAVSSPIVKAASSMKLSKAVQIASKKIGEKKTSELLEALKRI